ncbi:3'-5' exonuclease [Vreelandella neptunia]|uniref:3'-5' exonuclease n=1 Tax=Vreelandella neptunia TaxID=115551 RepID=A0ABZ0YK88_9GAMM|nr:3'-5' exonuclease [Halomonas neptunia]MDN3562408.1 3'-5' exonuclease [Halomonas neptunia]WQH11762.1 3'-5' exonuclease [Halomonas neptunia]
MSLPEAFPLKDIPRIEASPDDYRLIERVPFTKPDAAFPLTLHPAVGDERTFVVADVETTGLDTEADSIIELGLVRGEYSPSGARITSITDALSRFEDPGKPIPKEITQITGITDADVAGHRIDDEEIATWFEGDPLVIAHNARFDRPIMDRRFPFLAERGWACTASGIPWKTLGYEGRKLEYLLLKHGYFYGGHRAEVDCLATAWLMHINQEAFSQLLTSARQRTVVIRAFGAPFDVKDTLKARGYRWHSGDKGPNKGWWTEVDANAIEEEQAFLNATYSQGSEHAHYEPQTARTRFKGMK